VHKNAILTPRRRARLVRRVRQEALSIAQVALDAGVSPTTVCRQLRRTDGADRSSRPRRLARLHPRTVRRRIGRHCARRWSSLRIARAEGLPVPTVVTMQRR
jgi:transposase-like protein